MHILYTNVFNAVRNMTEYNDNRKSNNFGGHRDVCEFNSYSSNEIFNIFIF